MSGSMAAGGRHASGPLVRAPLALFLLLALLALPAGAASPSTAVPTQSGRRAVIEGLVFLRVPVPARGGLDWVARTYTGSSSNLKELERYNRRPRRGRLLEARVPLALLTPRYAAEAAGALFPKDRRTSKGWEHVWASGPYGSKETWDLLARWFADGSKVAGNLAAANASAGRRPAPGTRVVVPDGLLLDSLKAQDAPPPPPGPGLPDAKAAAPPSAPPSQAPTAPAGTNDDAAPAAAATPATPVSLTYGRDARGPYAVYHLQQGEALYSAVVVRFTGNVDADEVNALAMSVAKRSGIPDVTAIPVGFPVKIPLDDLLPQYLPPDDARYQEWAKNQSEMSTVANTYKNAALDGVVVVLDPGHGGLDRGAMKHGVWEDSYVYDIACRIREGLESRTKARVLMTLLVPHLGHKPQNESRLAPNKEAVILTHPWFSQRSREETKVEVNLRWHLANQYFLRLEKEGVDPDRVVFTSIHADSLHPSLRGSMFYIPGDAYRTSRWCSSGPAYQPYAEYKAQPCYEMSKAEMKRSEGLSFQFARKMEAAFGDAGLRLHPYNPTRDHVIRGKRSWVPAVLRNSIIPCSVLIEVCNLANAEDAKLIADPAFRQAVAEAYIQALIRYYS